MKNNQKYKNFFLYSSVEKHLLAGERTVLNLFRRASKLVPAYKDFLKRNKINPLSIKTFADFKKIPVTDKKNYVDNYKLADLVWDGNLSKNTLINSSSGTTGNPYFWPLDNIQIEEGEVIHEMIFKKYFQVDKKKTLLIITFGMGTWIAGMYTLLSTIELSKKYPMTMITPGFNKEEAIKIIFQISGEYEQIIIAGIPTFIKDLIDEVNSIKKKFLNGRTKLLISGEGISENWRDYVADNIGSRRPEQDIISVLGSADASIMGFETPETILLRKKLFQDNALNSKLFNSERIPAIAAFIPNHRFFETVGDELLITADRSIPLIRYNIHDKGGVFVNKKIKFPLVYLFGRGKFTATIYAANIYPDNVSMLLLDQKVSKFVTGRFTLETKFLQNQDHYLQINIELRGNVLPSSLLSDQISELFMNNVPKVNSEFARIKQEYGSKTKPKVILYKYNNDLFKSNNKIKKIS